MQHTKALETKASMLFVTGGCVTRFSLSYHSYAGRRGTTTRHELGPAAERPYRVVPTTDTMATTARTAFAAMRGAGRSDREGTTTNG